MVDIGFTHIALAVTNLDVSVEFYHKYASMHVIDRRRGVVWLSDLTRPFVLVLVEEMDIGAPLAPFSHLGIACSSREEVDRLCQEAKADGCFRSGPADSGAPVGYWVFLNDPDGHTLELTYCQEVGLAVKRAI